MFVVKKKVYLGDVEVVGIDLCPKKMVVKKCLVRSRSSNCADGCCRRPLLLSDLQQPHYSYRRIYDWNRWVDHTFNPKLASMVETEP